MRSPVPIFVLLLCFLATGVTGQSPRPHPGIALFNQAKFAEAIRSFEIAVKSKEHKSDAEIWNYLGLAYMANDQPRKSRSAFERSVEIDPASSTFQGNLAYAYLINRQIDKAESRANQAIELDPKNAQAYQVRATAHFWQGKVDPAERDADKFIELVPNNAEAYLLKSDILVAKLGISTATVNQARKTDFLKRAVDTLTVGVTRSQGHPRYAELERELESITLFNNHLTRDPTITSSTAVAAPDPGVTPLRIIEKPQAKYTDRARVAGVEGRVRVWALMGTNGKVDHVLVIKSLESGLDRQAVAAAKRIKFEPKLKDGKPVPTVLTIEYSFSIY